jgi:hypothetical protein
MHPESVKNGYLAFSGGDANRDCDPNRGHDYDVCAPTGHDRNHGRDDCGRKHLYEQSAISEVRDRPNAHHARHGS